METKQAGQSFSLGILISAQGTAVPESTSVSITAKGIFAKLKFSWTFSELPQSKGPYVFLLQRPWNAARSRALVNNLELSPSDGNIAPTSLPTSLYQRLSDKVSVLSEETTLIAFEPDFELQSLSLEFLLSVDLLWHQGLLEFTSQDHSRNLSLAGDWDLLGLPGATVTCDQQGQALRLESYEGQRYRWDTELNLDEGDTVSVSLQLDERKAASLAYFSPSPPDQSEDQRGSAAVAVIAPVRPQLVREPVHLSVVVETRNPQESLTICSLLESLGRILKADDQLRVLCASPNGVRCLLDWVSPDNIGEPLLLQIQDPESMGRSPSIAEDLEALQPDLRKSSHIVLAISGPGDGTYLDLDLEKPVFVFATRRKPHRKSLEALVARNGGFVCCHTGTEDSLNEFCDRLRIRLSPPLLKDFRLEGWGLEEVHPPGLTQVYTDEPTLVLGRYEGLLPKTVTLAGFSPSGQKLAQRVRVEETQDLDFRSILLGKHALSESIAKREGVLFATDGCRLLEIECEKDFGLRFLEVEPPPEPVVDISSEVEPDSGLDSDLSFVDAEPDWMSSGTPEQEMSEAFSSTEMLDTEDFFASAENELFFEADGLFSPSQEVSLELYPREEAADSLGDHQNPFPSFESGPPLLSDSLSRSETEEELFEGPSQISDFSLEGEDFFDSHPISQAGDPFHESLGPPEDSQSLEPFAELAPNPVMEESLDEEPDTLIGEPFVDFPSQLEPPELTEDHDFQEPDLFDEERPPSRESETPVRLEWVSLLENLPPNRAETWLVHCEIDTLALSLADLPGGVVEELLQKLPEPRRRAVAVQVAWGRALETEERLRAIEAISKSLEGELQR